MARIDKVMRLSIFKDTDKTKQENIKAITIISLTINKKL